MVVVLVPPENAFTDTGVFDQLSMERLGASSILTLSASVPASAPFR